MQTGLFGYKGRVHFKAADLLTEELQSLDRSLPKTELFEKIAELIDNHIYRNYRIYPGNYVALDLLEGTQRFTSNYTPEDKSVSKIILNPNWIRFLSRIRTFLSYRRNCY